MLPPHALREGPAAVGRCSRTVGHWPGGEASGRMRARVLAEAKTTFRSSYAVTIGLADVLDLESLTVASCRSTGMKYLIDPSRDRAADIARHG